MGDGRWEMDTKQCGMRESFVEEERDVICLDLVDSRRLGHSWRIDICAMCYCADYG